MATPIRRMNPANAAARAKANPAPAPAPKKQEVLTGRGFVATEAKRGKSDVYHKQDQEVEILRRVFEEGVHPAFVTAGAGLTINMGDFNSLRIDCKVSIPCLPHEIDQAFEIASNFVADRIAEEEVNWLGASKQPAQTKRK